MFQRNAAALLALAVLCTFALGADADTLGQIRKSGEIRLGYRTDAPPMSFTDANGQAAGYSVELCRRIATAVINGCIVCKNWRSQRDLPLLGVDEQKLDKSEQPDEAMYQAVLSGDLSSLSPKERVAVQYSQRIGEDPRGL